MADENVNKAEGPACGCGGGSCCSGPGKWIWIVLVLAVFGVLIAKNFSKIEKPTGTMTPSPRHEAAPDPASQGKPLPRLVDLGAGKCIPCKMMAPILDELKSSYTGQLEVVFIDVWENPEEGKRYGISLIPTQIFYDAQGKELFRHQGFFAKEDILKKWNELGVDLKPQADDGAKTPAGT